MNIVKKRLSDQVARELLAMISNNLYKIGDKLPVENQLAQMFQVSRVTIREAVRKLSIMGILDVRQGDGTFVKGLNPESFMKPLLPMLTLDKKNLQDIFEVRMLIECKAAELAAQNAGEEHLKILKELLDRMDTCAINGDLDHYNDYDARFHYEIANSSSNQVLRTIQGLLSDMVKDSIHASTSPPNALINSFIYHKKIYEALVNHDSQQAAEMMKIHISGGAEYIRTHL
jgi:GntR family transcriptional repressor for pyruvate dehydrogenase complex